VCGSDLNAARTLVKLSVLVGNDGNSSSNEGKYNVLADHVLISFVCGVYRNRGVTEKCFGTGGRNLNVSAASNEGVTDVPKVSLLIFVINLGVGDGCLTVRTPVDDPLAAVDESLFVKAYEYLAYRLGAALVESESLS